MCYAYFYLKALKKLDFMRVFLDRKSVIWYIKSNPIIRKTQVLRKDMHDNMRSSEQTCLRAVA